jgi:hydroxyacylglutathione hydrolase
MREIVILDVGGDANRSYCLLDHQTGDAWCVDPSYGASQILDLCTSRSARLTEIFLTHTHADHIASLPHLAKATGARTWVHALEPGKVPDSTPIPGEGPLPGLPEVEAIFTPGHTPGGTCYRVGDALFTGDVLFVDWVGRSDFQGGDPLALFKSLARLRDLPGRLVIHPGHSYGTVETRALCEEVLLNRFFSCRDFERFLALQPELSG